MNSIGRSTSDATYTRAPRPTPPRSHAGRAAGEVIVLDEPLSFWGGFDATTGRITDRHHPQVGLSLAGRVLVMPSGRGSSSSSSVLAEAIRAGTAPVAIILRESDLIVALGAIVAAELYGRQVPIAVVAAGGIRGTADRPDGRGGGGGGAGVGCEGGGRWAVGRKRSSPRPITFRTVILPTPTAHRPPPSTHHHG